MWLGVVHRPPAGFVSALDAHITLIVKKRTPPFLLFMSCFRITILLDYGDKIQVGKRLTTLTMLTTLTIMAI